MAFLPEISRRPIEELRDTLGNRSEPLLLAFINWVVTRTVSMDVPGNRASFAG